jgi:hypothetical protein
MKTTVIVADTQAGKPVVIEILECAGSTTCLGARRALVPAQPIQRQSIHLKSDEYTIVPQKETGTQPH